MKPITTKAKRFMCSFMALVICLSTVAFWRVVADDGYYSYYSTYYESVYNYGDYFNYPYDDSYIYDSYYMEQERWRYYTHDLNGDAFAIAYDEGIPEDAVRIRTAGELMAISRGPLSTNRYYVLENNITLTHEWSPIDDFRGTFDGQGFTISNLFVLESSNRRTAGFFGSTNRATVKNVTILIGDEGITGSYAVGGLIGRAGSTNVYRSSAIGNVTHTREFVGSVGGLIGQLGGRRVYDSFSVGTVSAVGQSRGSVSVGGLIGSVSWSRVINSYSASNIQISNASEFPSIGNVGGLLGVQDSNSSVAGSFRLSTQGIVVDDMPPVNPNFVGVSLAPDQMRYRGSFGGWDFDTIWEFRSGENGGFPVLRGQGAGHIPHPPSPWLTQEQQAAAATFIVQHGEQRFRPEVNGRRYYAYRVTGGVVFHNNEFSQLAPAFGNRYFLIGQENGVPYLVSDPVVQRDAGFMLMLAQEDRFATTPAEIDAMRRRAESTLTSWFYSNIAQQLLLELAENTIKYTMYVKKLFTGPPGWAYVGASVLQNNIIKYASQEVKDEIYEIFGAGLTVNFHRYVRDNRASLLHSLFGEPVGTIGTPLRLLPTEGIQSYTRVLLNDSGYITNMGVGLLAHLFTLMNESFHAQHGMVRVLEREINRTGERIAVNLKAQFIPGGLGTGYAATYDILVTLDLATSNIPASVTGYQRTLRNIERQMNTAHRCISHIDRFGNTMLATGMNARQRFPQTVIISCPVDVFVYNQYDERIGSIENDIITLAPGLDGDNPLFMEVNESTKFLMFHYEQNYRIEVVATDFGIMNYHVFRINDGGEIYAQTDIHDIWLEPEATFTINPSIPNTEIDYSRLYVNDAPHSVIITTTSTQGGAVYANSTGFIRGDSVILAAIPNELYRFVGWYENNTRVHALYAYEFTANSDRTLEGRFAFTGVAPTPEPTPTPIPTPSPHATPTPTPLPQTTPTPTLTPIPQATPTPTPIPTSPPQATPSPTLTPIPQATPTPTPIPTSPPQTTPSPTTTPTPVPTPSPNPPPTQPPNPTSTPGAGGGSNTRPNPQTSPIQISFAIFGAVMLAGLATFGILSIAKRQAIATQTYHKEATRFDREKRVVEMVDKK